MNEQSAAAAFTPPRTGRGRRRSPQVRARILAAADELLRRDGMAAFTIEGVAAMAGTSKVTIYRWWPSKGVLALEGYAAGVEEILDVPDSGDVRTDLTAALTAFARLLRDTTAGRVTAELIGAAQTDPELAVAFRRIYLQPRRAVGIAALRAAQARGQVRTDVDLEALSDQLWGACMYRHVTGLNPLTDSFVDELVANLLRGVTP